MADEKQAKAKRYKIPKGKNGLEFPGYHRTVTEALLNGPNGYKVVASLVNYEKERGIKIFGTLIVLE